MDQDFIEKMEQLAHRCAVVRGHAMLALWKCVCENTHTNT